MTPRAAAEIKVIRVTAPSGSQFKGYESYQVQDLALTARVVCYRRERWRTPTGETLVAPLPDGISGHFGRRQPRFCRRSRWNSCRRADLRRFVLMQYHQGQVTVERLATLLQAAGVSISKRQVMRLLIDGQDDFLSETRDVLRAGLETAGWITVDDTGARHRGVNAVCTQVGSDSFAWFGTTGSKSRVNFLELLRGGHADYVLNAAALDYMREHDLAGPVIRLLAGDAQRHFSIRLPGSGILCAWASPPCRRPPTRCVSPPRARCGAR